MQITVKPAYESPIPAKSTVFSLLYSNYVDS